MKKLTLTTIIISSMCALHAQTSWELSGNSASWGDFLGTTNNVPLILKTNGVEAIRIDDNQNIGIGTLPGPKMMVLSGSANSSFGEYGLCPDDDEENFGFVSTILSPNFRNRAIVGHINADNANNMAGIFRSFGSRSENIPCAGPFDNIGVLASSEGSGMEGYRTYNLGIVAGAQGNDAYNIAGYFDSKSEEDFANNVGGLFDVHSYNNSYAYNLGGAFNVKSENCNAENIGIMVEVEGGEVLVGLFASTIPDTSCTILPVDGHPLYLSNLAAYFEGNTLTTGVSYVLSDANYKKNKKEINNASDILSKIKTYSYEFDRSKAKGIYTSGGTHNGVLAQEVAEVLPHAVAKIKTPGAKNPVNGKSRDAQEIYAVNYQEFIPLLISAFNEKQEESDALKKEVEKQAQVIDLLTERLNALENKLNNICNNGCPAIQNKDEAPANQRSEGFRYYPNPTNNRVQIDLDNLRRDGEYLLNIYSSNGQLVYSKRVTNQDFFQEQLDTGSWVNGSYTITLSDKNKTVKSGTLMVTR